MSPTIRSKGGLPLMVGGGLVAGADECCCENPPPPVCGCPDLCIYRIEVVSPSALAIVSPLQGFCRDGVASSREVRPNVTELPEDVCHVEECQPWILEGGDPNDSPSHSFSSASSYLNAQVFESFVVTHYPEWCGCTCYIGFVIFASVECDDYTVWPPKFSVYIRCSYLVNQSNRWTDGSSVQATGFRIARFNLSSSECEKIGDRALCYFGDNRATYLSTPLTFDASWETTSLGGYDGPEPDVLDTATSQINPEFVELVNNILSSFSATFRITSRPSCNNVACRCNAVLGGMRVALGNLKQVSTPTPSSYEVSSSLIDTVWMYDRTDETVYWEGPFGFYEYDQKDPDGEQDGDGKFTRLLWRQRAELYCDLIDGVSQWFVLFTSFRTIYDNDGTITHYSYDQWVGKIDCYKACEDVGNDINAGDSLPMGEPYDIEYIGRTTQPGYLECEPPPRITISFKQVVTC